MNTTLLYFYNVFALFLPSTRMHRLKCAMLRLCGARIGTNVRICSSARFILNGQLSIGDNTWIGHEVSIVGGDAGVRIEADVDIAPRVLLVTGSHEISCVPPKAAGYGVSLPIVIRRGAWICAGATILGGVEVGERCIIGAGSLVNKSLESGVIAAGVPAVVKKGLPKSMISTDATGDSQTL
jgi:acetyltransferase-like isoleucine patch superfamily enzyme